MQNRRSKVRFRIPRCRWPPPCLRWGGSRWLVRVVGLGPTSRCRSGRKESDVALGLAGNADNQMIIFFRFSIFDCLVFTLLGTIKFRAFKTEFKPTSRWKTTLKKKQLFRKSTKLSIKRLQNESQIRQKIDKTTLEN